MATTHLYVRSDGNDTNDGTANDAAHATLTIQAAVDLIPDNPADGYTIHVMSAFVAQASTLTLDVPNSNNVNFLLTVDDAVAICRASKAEASSKARIDVSSQSVIGITVTGTRWTIEKLAILGHIDYRCISVSKPTTIRRCVGVGGLNFIGSSTLDGGVLNVSNCASWNSGSSSYLVTFDTANFYHCSSYNSGWRAFENVFATFNCYGCVVQTSVGANYYQISGGSHNVSSDTTADDAPLTSGTANVSGLFANTGAGTEDLSLAVAAQGDYDVAAAFSTWVGDVPDLATDIEGITRTGVIDAGVFQTGTRVLTVGPTTGQYATIGAAVAAIPANTVRNYTVKCVDAEVCQSTTLTLDTANSNSRAFLLTADPSVAVNAPTYVALTSKARIVTEWTSAIVISGTGWTIEKIGVMTNQDGIGIESSAEATVRRIVSRTHGDGIQTTSADIYVSNCAIITMLTRRAVSALTGGTAYVYHPSALTHGDQKVFATYEASIACYGCIAQGPNTEQYYVYSGTLSGEFNLSEDATAPGSDVNHRWRNVSNVFVNTTPGFEDLSLAVAVQGDYDVAADFAAWVILVPDLATDIVGTARTGVIDVGVSQTPAAGGGISPAVVSYILSQMRG